MVGFEEWVAVRGDAPYRLAYLLAGTRVEAEAVVEQALSRALPRWSRVVADDDPDASLRRAVVEAHRSWRARRRRGWPVPEVRPGEIADADLAEQDRVWRACLALPTDQRVAVVLGHHEAREPHHPGDAADLMGLDDGAFESLVADALDAVGARLAGEGEDDARDLGARVAASLAGTAGRAPVPGDLAAGARDRLRRRRRTTGAVAAAVAAGVAGVAVVVGLGLFAAPGEPPDRETAVDSQTPGTWVTETWRDLSVRVPPGWTGPPACPGATAPDDRPLVTRPVIACTPDSGYGVHFLEPGGELPPGTEGVVQRYRGDRYPDGAWIGYARTRNAAVWVVGDDRLTTRLVLDSSAPVGEVDVHGCATRVETESPSGRSEMSVCRYTDNGWLEQSELLSRSESVEARSVVEGGAGVGSPPDGTCTASPSEVLMSVDGFRAEVSVSYRWFAVEEQCGWLTPEVRYWAVSPGTLGATRAD